MKKLLAVLAIVAVSGSFAKAEDKGTEFKFGGQLRQRYMYDNNPTFLSSGGINESSWAQRNQFHVNAISGDRLQAYFNVIHTAMWGAAGNVPQIASPYATTATTVGAPNLATTGNTNTLQVNEAWLWWKASDMLSFRAGRQSATYGDGFFMSKNDWLANPYAFDGLMGRLSWDFLDLDFGGAKLADLGAGTFGGTASPGVATPGNVASGVAAGPSGTANTDSEVNMYALYASVKNLPEVLKTVDVMVAQLNGDQGLSGGAFAPGFVSTSGSYALTTIGLHLKGDVAMVDYRGEAGFQTGKQKSTIAGGSDVTFAGNMYDLEVGFNFPEFMKARLSAAYHMDTGNDSTDVTKNNAYQPLFYDVHNYAGYMNFFTFGNFTDIRIKLSLQPEETAEYGVMVNLASRTTSNSAYAPLTAASGGMFQSTGATLGTAGTAASNTDKALGTEIDLYANHTYGHGLSSGIYLGYLSLGQYFKQNGASIGTGIQALGQVTYNF